MIKSRNAYICNLKFLLIYLVVLGHTLEYFFYKELALHLYKIIYLFHMPVFVFISGMFTKTIKACKKQWVNTLSYYIIAQGIVVFYKAIFAKTAIGFIKPYWHLWYLLSLVFWSWLGMLVIKMQNRGVSSVVILVIAIVASCVCGCIPWINRTLSLSRTIVFFPYYFLGMMVRPTVFREKRKLGFITLIPLILGMFILLCLNIDYSFFYHAQAFGPNISNIDGIILRGLCFGVACFAGITIFSFMPNKRFAFTKFGMDTLPIYLLHVLVLPMIYELSKMWEISLVIAMVMILVLMKIFYLMMSFVRPVCTVSQ